MNISSAHERYEERVGVALVSPTVLLFMALIAYPLLHSLWLSLNDVNTLTQDSSFVGLQNYSHALSDPEFWHSLINTFIWTVGVLVLQVGIGIGFALLLHRNLWARSFARGLVLFPYLLPMVVAVLVWKWLFNDLYGVLNFQLTDFGLITTPVDWLGSMPNAMLSLILVGSWKYFPFVVLTVLARLQTIPLALYEAATVDGAGAWSRFWDITMPHLKGVIGIVILLRAIWDFKEFDLIFMMTGGGPVTSTQTLPLLVYKYAFPLMQLGRAAAIAVLMMAIMLVMIWAYLRISERAEKEVG